MMIFPKHSGTLIVVTVAIAVAVLTTIMRNRHQDDETGSPQVIGKLENVRQRILSRCEVPEDRQAFAEAKLFQELDDLPMEVVGFSVPINSGKNRAYISFTLEHFQSSTVDSLAAEGLEDFQMAKSNGDTGKTVSGDAARSRG